MTDVLTAKPRFSEIDSPDEIQRPFRPSALVTLLLGVISVGAVFTIQLLFLPILTVALGLYACRPAPNPATIPVGRTLAVIGLALALLFGSWSMAHYVVRKDALAEQAEPLAQQWLTLLAQGRSAYAFELTRLPHQRQLEGMDLDRYYTPDNEMAYESYMGFVGRTSVKAILDADQPPTWELDAVLHTDRNRESEEIELRMIDTSGTITRPLILSMGRTPPTDATGRIITDAPYQWRVSDVYFEDEFKQRR